ncbi:glycosyltransferase family 4 protein [Pseudomonas knackmussii]|uniref:glycosyltransferase family 4 protein n=1 Tax=Pseudomonas knackmussii TaxID=65741 RepID=UPI00136264AC|nr:glycosyltransferase family 1 protein [Pseudomonas knackmussii]
MKIWLDMTTTLGWDRPALGIVRVEAETARYFLNSRNPAAHFCRFDQSANCYFEVTRDEVSIALSRLDAGGHSVGPVSNQHTAEAESTPRASYVVPKPALEENLKKLALKTINSLPVAYRGKALKWAHTSRSVLSQLLSKHVATSQSGKVRRNEFSHKESSDLYAHALSQPFNRDDVYLSLGLDWDQKNLELLYYLKRDIGLKVLLFCYDVIPIKIPEHCVAGVPEKFPGYFVDAAWCADKILCISECSRNDLNDYLETVGAPVPPLDVVRLGSDIITIPDTPPSEVIRETVNSRYILFVSTIESRKNHLTLYQAYRKLLDASQKDIPSLIFVGMQGWGIDKLICALESDAQMQNYIKIFNRVSDTDLNHLYKHALFTVYPSLYEGWGLPVAESLAHGKLCLASSAASIPEVGGDLVEYIDPLDSDRWAEQILWYSRSLDAVAERETRIEREYQPTYWEQTGSSILEAACALAQQPGA